MHAFFKKFFPHLKEHANLKALWGSIILQLDTTTALFGGMEEMQQKVHSMKFKNKQVQNIS